MKAIKDKQRAIKIARYKAFSLREKHCVVRTNKGYCVESLRFLKYEDHGYTEKQLEKILVFGYPESRMILEDKVRKLSSTISTMRRALEWSREELVRCNKPTRKIDKALRR